MSGMSPERLYHLRNEYFAGGRLRLSPSEEPKYREGAATFVMRVVNELPASHRERARLLVCARLAIPAPLRHEEVLRALQAMPLDRIEGAVDLVLDTIEPPRQVQPQHRALDPEVRAMALSAMA